MTVKFRLKYLKQAKPLVVEFESSNVTFADLKDRVIDLLQNAEIPVSGIQRETLQLSLNGKDAIAVEDSCLASSFGLVPGDTIHVLGLTQAAAASKPVEEPDEPKTPQSKREPTEDDMSHAKEKLFFTLSECADGGVPQLLENLLKADPAQSKDDLNIIAILLHILMKESGFIPEEDRFEDYPLIWRWTKGSLRLRYKSSLPPYVPCSLVLLSMGPVVAVHGTCSTVKKTFTLTVDPRAFVTAGEQVVTRNLRTLSLQFKNSVSFPLLVSVQQDTEGGTLPASLPSLPPEVMFVILRKLDVQSLGRFARCSRVCHEYAENPLLWKYLFLRDFKLTPRVQDVRNPDWKKLYKEERERRNVKITCIVPFFSPDTERIPYNPYPFLPPVIDPPPGNFPGVVGGDYDLYPNLMGLEPPRRRGLPDARPPPMFGPRPNPMFRHF